MLIEDENNKPRCAWVVGGKPDYINYHDHEWGVPVHDDKILFEMLILEGAQAGLSWYTILKRRSAYRKAFKNFDVIECSALTDGELETLLANNEIIRNRLKVFSVRKNAKVFIQIQQEFGAFDSYLWRFVGGQTIANKPKNSSEIHTHNNISDLLSKDLKKRGMSFVGTTIIYGYMQAVGLINDHTSDCYSQAQIN